MCACYVYSKAQARIVYGYLHRKRLLPIIILANDLLIVVLLFLSFCFEIT